MNTSAISLSCNFNYTIRSNILVLHPVITGETDYKWEISNQSQITGETDWILSEDKNDFIFIPFIRETFWVKLIARNTTSNTITSRIQKIEMFKSTPEDKRRSQIPTIEIESSPSYTRTSNFFKSLGWDIGNISIWIIIGIILLIVLIIIFVLYPRDVWIYPIIKNKK